MQKFYRLHRSAQGLAFSTTTTVCSKNFFKVVFANKIWRFCMSYSPMGLGGQRVHNFCKVTLYVIIHVTLKEKQIQPIENWSTCIMQDDTEYLYLENTFFQNTIIAVKARGETFYCDHQKVSRALLRCTIVLLSFNIDPRWLMRRTRVEQKDRIFSRETSRDLHFRWQKQPLCRAALQQRWQKPFLILLSLLFFQCHRGDLSSIMSGALSWKPIWDRTTKEWS